ncbi:MAG TPA: serine hydrolase [Polyangia bacterium]|nr:serine hydrolase [Polyangia bacterium]
MRGLLILLLLGVMAQAAAAGPAPHPDLRLTRRLASLAQKHKGQVALYAKHLKTGQTVAWNAEVPVKTASVIKLGLLVEAFLEVKEGRRQLGDKVLLRDEEKVAGSGVLHFAHGGLELTLEDTLWNMIVFSDNTATNLMIDVLGTRAVNERMAALGLGTTWLYKKIGRPATEPMPPDQKQFGLGKSTAAEMGRLVEWLARCELGDPALCRKMIWMMRNQQYRGMLPRFLESQDTTEKETPSYVAAKIGALDQVRNDVGILYTQAGPIVVAVFTWDNKDTRWNDQNQAEVLIGRLAEEIVRAWSPKGMQTKGDIPIPAPAPASAQEPRRF